jgi:hypothetical protein
MAKQQSLVEQAKAITSRSGRPTQNISKEDEELAAAWVSGDVAFTQVSKVKNFTSASVTYSFLALALRQMLNSNGRMK